MKRSIALVAGLAVAILLDHAAAQQPSPMLAIDQHRTTVVERILDEWGDRITATDPRVSRAQLREMLDAMRADQLLAASLVGSPEGLRGVLAHSHPAQTASVTRPQAKALGDAGDDVVYTPVTPCRLVDTRGSFAAVYQGGGAFGGGSIRNYMVQTANGVCTSQLPVGLSPAAVQLQVFGIPISGSTSGDIEILPEGSVFGATATEVYVGNVAFNTVSTTARINPANNQIGVQVRGGGAHVAIDVVGYFKRPRNYGGTHVITGVQATDSGGLNNTASGNYSTVSGGQGNIAGNLETTVGGGSGNTASGYSSTVGGGSSNAASGDGSTIPGGAANKASGIDSFAIGFHANANNNGCFVWGDFSTVNEVNCTGGQNQVVMRALGGFYFLTAGSGPYTGAQLPGGAGAWTTFSDRAGKDGIRPVDSKEVLRKLVSLPIATWSWKAQDASIRHMGPMAQDFSAAFGLGETDKGISTVDADGVALAAIQGLHQRADEGDAHVLALERRMTEVEALRAEVTALKAILTRMLRAGPARAGAIDDL